MLIDIRILALAALILPLCACTKLLHTDFDELEAGGYLNEVVNLPGSPSGDRMISKGQARISVSDTDDTRNLFIDRNVIVSDSANHVEAFFDPLPADDNKIIYFAWEGEIRDLSGDSPRVAAKLRDLITPDQPNLFSKLILRFGSGSISAQNAGGIDTTIGFGVTGRHTAVLRINPQNRTYGFSLSGPGVEPGGGISHEGNLSPGTSVDPENIGLTLTFDDDVEAGGSVYEVFNFTISQRVN